MNAARLLLAPLAVLLLACSTQAKEITTNGLGGGDWSESATWRGKLVPGPKDDVVLRKGDTVVFDRNDEGKVTCNLQPATSSRSTRAARFDSRRGPAISSSARPAASMPMARSASMAARGPKITSNYAWWERTT